MGTPPVSIYISVSTWEITMSMSRDDLFWAMSTSLEDTFLEDTIEKLVFDYLVELGLNPKHNGMWMDLGTKESFACVYDSTTVEIFLSNKHHVERIVVDLQDPMAFDKIREFVNSQRSLMPRAFKH